MVGAQDEPVDPILATGGQCRIEIAEVARLGSLSDPASLIEPERVEVAPRPADAGWVVADDAGSVVHAYDRSGTYRGAYVPRGEGPGEIRRPDRVALDQTDSLWVSQSQGRAVVIGPGGEGRTIVSPEQYAVDGHTPEGLPYAVRLWVDIDDVGRPIMATATLGALIMDREGSVVRTIGPISSAPSPVAARPPQGLRTSMTLAPIGDSAFLGPLRSGDELDAWVGYWSEEGVEPLVYVGDVADVLGTLPDSFQEPLSGGVLQLIGGDDGGAWAVARVRAVSDRVAEQIQDEVYREAGSEPTSIARNDALPRVANQVNRTLLFHIDPDGQVTDAVLTHDSPRGFVDSESFFSLEGTEQGLLRVRIRGFSRQCDGKTP